MADVKRKLTCLTLDQKCPILNSLKSNKKTRKVTIKEFNCNVNYFLNCERRKINKEMALEIGYT